MKKADQPKVRGVAQFCCDNKGCAEATLNPEFEIETNDIAGEKEHVCPSCGKMAKLVSAFPDCVVDPQAQFLDRHPRSASAIDFGFSSGESVVLVPEAVLRQMDQAAQGDVYSDSEDAEAGIRDVEGAVADLRRFYRDRAGRPFFVSLHIPETDVEVVAVLKSMHESAPEAFRVFMELVKQFLGTLAGQPIMEDYPGGFLLLDLVNKQSEILGNPLLRESLKKHGIHGAHFLIQKKVAISPLCQLV